MDKPSGKAERSTTLEMTNGRGLEMTRRGIEMTKEGDRDDNTQIVINH